MFSYGPCYGWTLLRITDGVEETVAARVFDEYCNELGEYEIVDGDTLDGIVSILTLDSMHNWITQDNVEFDPSLPPDSVDHTYRVRRILCH